MHARDQRTIRRRRRDVQPRGVFEAPIGWNGEKGGFWGKDVRCVCALRCAEDAVAYFESWTRRSCRSGDDGAGKLGAGDPGQGWLVLVFAADLEEVEEIDAAGADSD